MRLALGLGALLLLVAGLAPARAETVTVEVSGLRSGAGQVVVSLWDRADGFGRFDTRRALATRSVPAAPGGRPVRVTFENVPPGRYALSAFHDADGDGKLKTNFIGMPREGVGVSNNPGGMPSFTRSQLAVPASGPVAIALRHLGD